MYQPLTKTNDSNLHNPIQNPPNINRITKNIFLANWTGSVDPKILEGNNIRYIIGLNTKSKTNADLDLYKSLKIKYLHVKQRDTSHVNIIRIFPTTNKFIRNALTQNKNILIHCTMGISRASTTVMAFLLWAYYAGYRYDASHGTDVINSICYNHRHLNDIYKYIKERRPQIGPNKGFIRQLQVYETSLICHVIHI